MSADCGRGIKLSASLLLSLFVMRISWCPLLEGAHVKLPKVAPPDEKAGISLETTAKIIAGHTRRLSEQYVCAGD